MNRQFTIQITGEGLDASFTAGEATTFDLLQKLFSSAVLDLKVRDRSDKKPYRLSVKGRENIARAARKRWAAYRKERDG